MATLTREELLRRKKQQEELLASGSVTGIDKKPVTAIPVPQIPAPTNITMPVPKTPAPTPTPVVDTRTDGQKYLDLTPEERAQQQADINKLGKVLTDEDIAANQLRNQQLEQDKLDRQIAEQRTLNEQKLRQSKDTAGANKAAFQSQLIAAPGALTASTGEPLVGAINALQQEQIGNLQTSINNYEANIKTAQEQINMANQEGNSRLAESLAKRKTQLETAKLQAQKDLVTAEKERTTETLNLTKQKATNFINATNALDSFSVSALGNMTSDDVVSFYKNAGAEISPLMAQGVVSSYQKIAELAKSKSADDQLKAQLERRKLMVDIENAQKTEATKAIEGVSAIDSAIASGEMSQATGDALKAKLGYAEKPVSKLEEQMKQADIAYKNAQTQTERYEALKKKTELNDLQASFGVDNPINKLAQYENGDQPSRGQCGEFVNDTLGFSNKLFGNTFQSKTKNINSYEPKVGSVFISSLSSAGNTGHVGFVESINEDGSVTLVDSNRYGDEKVNRRTVTPDQLYSKGEKIVGFYDATQDVKLGQEKQNNQIYLDAISNIAASETKDKRTAKVARVKELIQRGDVDQAENFIKQQAAAGLTGAPKEDYTVFGIVEGEAPRALSNIDKFKVANPGLWKNIIESKKPWIGASKDQSWVALKSDVDQVVAQYRKALFGASVTQGEKDAGGNFLIDATDNAETMFTKLKSMADFAERTRSRIVEDQIGVTLPSKKKATPETSYLDKVQSDLNDPVNSYLKQLGY